MQLRRREIRAAVTALAVAVVVAGCSAAPPDLVAPSGSGPAVASPRSDGSTSLPWMPQVQAPVTPAQTPTELQGTGANDAVEEADLNAMATVMSTALEDGDPSLWLSLFGDDAEMLGLQQAWFTTVAAVPMDRREMYFIRLDESDGGSASAQFGFRHQVTGADRVPAVQYYTFDLDRDADGFLHITQVSGTTGVTATYPQVWDLGPAAVLVDDAIVAIVPAEDADRAHGVLPELSLAATEVLGDFPVDGVDRVVVNLGDAEDLESLFALEEVAGYAGFAVYIPNAAQVEEQGEGAGARMVSGDDRTVRTLLDLSYVIQELDVYGPIVGGSPLMRHEGLHAVMMLQAPIFGAPLWVSEGFAGWYETTGDPDVTSQHFEWYEMVADEPPTELPPSASLTFHGDDVERNYAESAMVFHYIEERWGYDVTYDLGIALQQSASDGRTVDEVLQENLDLDQAAFEADFIEWAGQYTG